MTYIKIEELSKSFGDRIIIDKASFYLGPGQIAGLVGMNGQGKTTLMKIIAGLEESDGGICEVNGRAGYLPQRGDVFSGTVRQLLSGRAGHLQKKAIGEVGLSEDYLDLKFSSLSGGEKTRVKLARLLVDSPDFLLLDEPTNHLDVTGLEWLEKFILSYHGPVLVISHDRFFLDRVAVKILELANGKLAEYTGNYTDYAQVKRQNYDRQLREYEDYLNTKKRLEETVKRKMQKARRVAKKRRPKDSFEARCRNDFFQAKAKKVAQNAKAIEKRLAMLPKKEKPEKVKNISVKFGLDIDARSRVLIRGEGVQKAFGQKVIFSNVEFQITKGRRIALLGANGSGKTTLLRLVVGSLEPDRGEIVTAPTTLTGYLEQELEQLNPRQTALEAAFETSRAARMETRTILGTLLFKGDDVFKQVSCLSMGERVRLSLGRLILTGCNLLILDEPTNHLDLASREAVEQALEDYPGTVLFVSHDRYFLDKLATEIWELNGGQLRCFPGTYQEYTECRKNDQNNIQLLQLEVRLSQLSAELNQCGDPVKQGELNAEFIQLSRAITRARSRNRS